MDRIILPAGQGTSNWSLGWSAGRFAVIGQNDFTCMINPEMYREFCWDDNNQCCDYMDASLYHLDGPQALRHLPAILEYKKLNAINWVPGAGAPGPLHWIEEIRQMQAGGKRVHMMGYSAAEVIELCRQVEPGKLFMVTYVSSVEQADEVVKQARIACDERRGHK
jgi:5-methyltetrahydrofolate--homocysteine methyltransferase